MKLILNIVGAVLVLAGLFFALEGAKILQLIALGHFTRYLLGGIGLVVLGVVAFIFANQKKKSTPPAS
jgi:hypothetical protein